MLKLNIKKIFEYFLNIFQTKYQILVNTKTKYSTNIRIFSKPNTRASLLLAQKVRHFTRNNTERFLKSRCFTRNNTEVTFFWVHSWMFIFCTQKPLLKLRVTSFWTKMTAIPRSGSLSCIIFSYSLIIRIYSNICKNRVNTKSNHEINPYESFTN